MFNCWNNLSFMHFGLYWSSASSDSLCRFPVVVSCCQQLAFVMLEDSTARSGHGTCLHSVSTPLVNKSRIYVCLKPLGFTQQSNVIVQLGSTPYVLLPLACYKMPTLRARALKMCIERVCHETLFTTEAFQTMRSQLGTPHQMLLLMIRKTTLFAHSAGN